MHNGKYSIIDVNSKTNVLGLVKFSKFGPSFIFNGNCWFPKMSSVNYFLQSVTRTTKNNSYLRYYRCLQ